MVICHFFSWKHKVFFAVDCCLSYKQKSYGEGGYGQYWLQILFLNEKTECLAITRDSRFILVMVRGLLFW